MLKVKLRYSHLEYSDVTRRTPQQVYGVVLSGSVDLDDIDGYPGRSSGLEIGNTTNDLHGKSVEAALLRDNTVGSCDDVGVIDDATTADALADDLQGDLVGEVTEIGVFTTNYSLAVQSCLNCFGFTDFTLILYCNSRAFEIDDVLPFPTKKVDEKPKRHNTKRRFMLELRILMQQWWITRKTVLSTTKSLAFILFIRSNFE